MSKCVLKLFSRKFLPSREHQEEKDIWDPRYTVCMAHKTHHSISVFGYCLWKLFKNLKVYLCTVLYVSLYFALILVDRKVVHWKGLKFIYHSNLACKCVGLTESNPWDSHTSRLYSSRPSLKTALINVIIFIRIDIILNTDGYKCCYSCNCMCIKMNANTQTYKHTCGQVLACLWGIC